MDEPDPTPEEVEAVWTRRWRTSALGRGRGVDARLAAAYSRFLRGGAGVRHIAGEIDRAAGGLAGKRVLDAGTGTGLVAVALARKGAHTTVLDVSEEALAIARSNFAAAGRETESVLGSVFELPFADGCFDVVTNTGLLEHFQLDRRREALAEMLRVLRPDGVCITFNPSADARLYRRLKVAAERRGTWDVGVELPIATLADVLDTDTYALEERTTGWFMQLHFVKYVVPRPLDLLASVAGELGETALGRLPLPGGYLLVSTIRRRPVNASPPPPATSPGPPGAGSSQAPPPSPT